MKLNRFTISGLILFFVGAAKMFIWSPLFNKKPWFAKFNTWYGKLMIACTLVFFGICLWELVKLLFVNK